MPEDKFGIYLATARRVIYLLVALLLTPTFAAPHSYSYVTSQSYAAPWSCAAFLYLRHVPEYATPWSCATFLYLRRVPELCHILMLTYVTSQSYSVTWSYATFLYLRHVPELCRTLELRHILILTPRPKATPHPGATPYPYTYAASQSYSAPWSCATSLYLRHVSELLRTLELCHTPRTTKHSA